MKAKEFIKKLQTLPEEQRKIILWALVALIGTVFFIFWFNSVKKNLKSLDFNASLAPLSSSLNGGGSGSKGIGEQAQELLDQLNQQQ